MVCLIFSQAKFYLSEASIQGYILLFLCLKSLPLLFHVMSSLLFHLVSQIPIMLTFRYFISCIMFSIFPHWYSVLTFHTPVLMVSLFQTVTWWWSGITYSPWFSWLSKGLLFDRILPFTFISITLVLCISMIVLGKILQWFAIAFNRLHQVVGMVSGWACPHTSGAPTCSKIPHS